MIDRRSVAAEIDAASAAASGLIVVLNRDAFFGIKIGNMLRAQGYRVAFAKTAQELIAATGAGDPAVLAIIDINAKPAWDELAGVIGGESLPTLAFGSHLDVEGLRAAKAAGVTRVVSNGDFHRDMLALVRRYARRPSPAQ